MARHVIQMTRCASTEQSGDRVHTASLGHQPHHTRLRFMFNPVDVFSELEHHLFRDQNGETACVHCGHK